MARHRRYFEFTIEGQPNLQDLRDIVHETESLDGGSLVNWQNMGSQLEGTAWRFTIEEV